MRIDFCRWNKRWEPEPKMATCMHRTDNEYNQHDLLTFKLLAFRFWTNRNFDILMLPMFSFEFLKMNFEVENLWTKLKHSHRHELKHFYVAQSLQNEQTSQRIVTTSLWNLQRHFLRLVTVDVVRFETFFRIDTWT